MPSFDVAGALKAGHSPAEIADEMGRGSGFNVEGARTAGHSNDQIIAEIQAGPPSASFMDDLKGGVHDLSTGLAQTANVIGGVANRNGYTGVGDAATATGKFLADHTTDPVAPNPANNVGEALKDGRYSDLPGAVAHSAARMLPSVVPMLGAALVPGVGPAIAGGIAGAESLGPTAYQRAQNNGRAEPTTSDVVGALPSTAVNAVAGAYLPGGSAAKIASPLLRAGAKTGIEAGTGAVMEASNELGGSVGTDAGAHIDPYAVAGAGVTQGAIGAGRQVAPLAREGVKATSDNVMSRIGDQPVSVDDAASMSRVGKAYDAQLQAVEGTRAGNVRPTDVLNSMKQENLARTKEYARSLNKSGILSDELSATVGNVLEQARRHNNEIVDGGLDTSSLFDDIKNSGIHPDALQPLLNGIRDQNTLSKQSFLKNQTGPFQQLGNGISQLAAIGLPLSHGNLPGAAMALMGHGVVGKIGGLVGGTLDSALGTATPKILLQRMAADRYLKQNGADAGPSTIGSLQDATANLTASTPSAAAPPSVDALAQAKIDRFVRNNAVTLAAADKLPTDTVHQDSVAGTAAMVKALQDAARTTALAGRAPETMQDRMAVGNPVGDLIHNIGGPSEFPLAASNGLQASRGNAAAQPKPQTPQPAPAPPQAPPMASPPVAAPVVSGPAPSLNPATPAVQGRPWEQYIGKTLPGVTRAHVQEAVNAVHTPDVAAQINGAMGGVDAAHLQPVIEHLRASLPGGNGTQEITMPRQWEAAKASYQEDTARKASEAQAAGLEETAKALAEVGITKGRDAKAAIRDAHLAGLVDASRRSQAAAMFSKRLMNHGPK